MPLEDEYLKTHTLIFFMWWSTSSRSVPCSLSPPPQFTPSLPEFMKGIMHFPLLRALCQLTGSHQWEPFSKKQCRSRGLAVFHELLIYSESVSCYRPSFHLLKFEISGFIALSTCSTWGEQWVSELVCSILSCTKVSIVYKYLGGPFSLTPVQPDKSQSCFLCLCVESFRMLDQLGLQRKY